MRRRIASLVALLSAAAFLVSCGDNARKTFPTGPQPGERSSTVVPGACTTLSNLQSLVSAVFGAGSPNAQSALGKLNNMDKQLQQGNIAGAQAQAQNIVSFVQQKAAQGTLPGTTAQIDALLGSVLCYVGLSPDTFLVLPTDNPQILKTGAGNAGLSLQGNTVTVPTLITINTLPGNANPLVTKLDQYPGFIDVTASSGLTKDAVVGVCPSTVIPQDVLGRLRLGHQSSTNGFEITPAADASFLDCSGQTAQSHVPEWLQRLASVVLPTTLYAKPPTVGGIGGSVGQFSPFAPVDPVMSVVGGVGGTGGQFQLVPKDSLRVPSAAQPKTSSSSPSFSVTPGNRSYTVNSSGQCVSIDALVGNPTEVACRPTVTLTTHNGTLLTSVPVGWAVTAGGGTIAPEVTATQTCGTFGSTASTTTDANAKAAICWTLGATPGTNTVVATPTDGGDVPSGASFSPATIIFTATADQIVPTATATGGTFPYDTKQHAGGGTCDNNLTPALSYSGDGSVPTNVGTYTLTVTCGAGNPLFVTITQTATIQITPAATTTTLNCPTTEVFNNSAYMPCSASVTGPGLSQSVTPQYSGNTNVGTTSVTASYTGVGNYQSSSASASFTITPAPTSTVVTCPPSVPFTGSAQTPCGTAIVSGPGLSTTASVGYTANVNAGPVTASASYAGGGNYLGSSGSTTFQIGPAATTASISCPLSVTYTGSAVTPCTGSVTGPGLSQSLTPTYSNNVVGQATATVNYPGGGNYLASTASKTFQILYVQSVCFASPVYSVMPSTKSFQNAGSNLPVKCTLRNAQGGGVSTAQGALLVEDLGTNGTATPSTVVAVPNAFSASSSGNYSYGLNTGLAGFISGHFYRVTATWSDGSTTVGFFFIK